MRKITVTDKDGSLIFFSIGKDDGGTQYIVDLHTVERFDKDSITLKDGTIITSTYEDKIGE